MTRLKSGKLLCNGKGCHTFYEGEGHRSGERGRQPTLGTTHL